jgi:hypothetical protein
MISPFPVGKGFWSAWERLAWASPRGGILSGFPAFLILNQFPGKENRVGPYEFGEATKT